MSNDTKLILVAAVTALIFFAIGYQQGLKYLPPKQPTCRPFNKVFYDKQRPGLYYKIDSPNPDQVFLTCY